MGKLINFDKSEGVESPEHPIGYIALMLLHNYLYDNVEEFRLSPRLRKPRTLDELRSCLHFKEDDSFDETVLVDYTPTESELIRMVEEERAKERKPQYELEFVKEGEVITGIAPPTAITPAIINRFRSYGSDGKLNVVYQFKRYEIPVTISECLTFEGNKLEELVLGKPKEIAK